VGLAWTPNNSLTGHYAGRKAEAQLQRARADLAAQEDAVRMEVVNAYQSYKAAEAVTVASEARLTASEEAYRVRLAMYRVGAGVIVDLLNADLTVSQARLQRANAAINSRAALAALRRAAAVEP
jgi:outer membrane protein TolC